MNFKQAEKRFKQLKTQFVSGTLNEIEFKTQLEKLMIRDESGCWWMIGYETEKWYRHDGTDWVQTSLPGSYLQSSLALPKWISILWIILGWSISWLVGTLIFQSLGTSLSFDLRLAIGGIISGIIGGFTTALVLRSQDVILDWKIVFWITLAWMVGSAVGWPIRMAISMGFGGLVVALILRGENRLSDWNSVVLVALAWAIGSAIGGEVKFPLDVDPDRLVGRALGGAIGGAIGGLVTIWQVRYGKRV